MRAMLAFNLASHWLLWLETRCQRLSRRLVAGSGRFDSSFYLEEYPDVASVDIDPLKHYCAHGWREGRRPGPMAHPDYIALGPIGRHFSRNDPILVWALVGRWLGWSLTWPQIDTTVEFKAVHGDIAIVVHEATRTGAPIHALRLARWLRDTGGVKPVIVLLAGGSLVPEICAEFTCLPLFSLKRSERSSYLHIVLQNIRVLYLNSLASLQAWDWIDWRGNGLILHVHESAANIALYAPGLAAIAPARPHVVAVNESCREPLAEALGSQPHIVPPAIDSKRGRTSLRAHAPQVVAGCGTMSLRKGADLFCQVAAKVTINLGADIEFIWIGGSGDVDMAALLARYDLAKRIKLIGEVADPLPLLSEASVLMLPSRDDPFPLAALEAASCGVPVTCFDVLADGVGTWISQGAGEVVPAFDIDAMAAAVMRLLTDPVWHGSASKAALRAAKRFDIAQTGPQIAAIINQAVGEAMVKVE